MTEETKQMQSMDEIEEWFLEAAASDLPPVAEMLAKLKMVCAAGGATAGGTLVEMVRDVLIQQADFQGMVTLVQIWSAARGSRLDATTCREWLQKSTKDRLKLAFLKHVGVDASSSVEEYLRRIELLGQLTEGSYCYDKTWGFGIVKRLDDFYGKVSIDFRRKHGHQMTFAYAGETLQILPEGHLLARTHADRDGLRAMASETPWQLVRLALESLGDMTIADLKDCLTEDLLSEAEWKGFWDGARKGLRNEPLVEVPAKRSERIRLLASARSYDDAWFADLATEKSRERTLALLRELHAAGESVGNRDGAAAIIADRVAFAAKGLADSQPGLLAALLLSMQRLGVPAQAAGLSFGVLSDTPTRLAGAITEIGAKERGDLLLALHQCDPEQLKAGLLNILPQLPVSELEECVSFLIKDGSLQDVMDCMRPLVEKQEPGILLSGWLARHAAEAIEWGLTDPETIVLCSIHGLEAQGAGEELKAQKIIRQLFLTDRWLDTTVGNLADAGRARILTRVQRSSGWDSSEKRSVLGRLVKRYPDLQIILSGDGPSEEKSVRLTSWRSLRERQEQYTKLMEEDIPANSKEIGVARSYGDLRENFEYQAAKDQQRLLMRRKAELEADLSVVKGTDFKDAKTDTIGMGVEVEIATDSGEVRLYRILGEWDRDEELSIISSESAVAQALFGKAVGERVSLPTPGGEEQVEIRTVQRLSPEVIAWSEGR